MTPALPEGVGRSGDAPAGFTLTLEGPNGPSSVELSWAECLALAEGVAAARPASRGGLDADSPPNAAAVVADRLATDSPLRGWLVRQASHDPVALRSARAAAGFSSAAADNAAWFGRLSAAASRAAAQPGDPPHSPLRLVAEVAAAVEQAWVAQAGFEEAVVEARMESMKQLAYGAGHEINNPLANIATRAQSLLPGESDPERRRRLATIIDQAFRARDMIGGLMLFARPPKGSPGPVAAVEIVDSAVASVAAAAVQRGIAIEVERPGKPIVGSWDRGQIEEAVRAVLINAIEAGRNGGRIAVRVVPDRAPAGPEFCRIAIVDDGPGMDRQTLSRAFDPFFSGREAGRGIGLGLSKAWRLVEIHGGRTTIESVYGSGTTVSIELPVDGCPLHGRAEGRKLDAASPV